LDGTSLSFVQPTQDHGEAAQIAAAEDDEHIVGAADVAFVGGGGQALLVFDVRNVFSATAGKR
jgi:hypothetical protein